MAGKAIRVSSFIFLVHLSFALSVSLPLICKCEFSQCLRVCVRDRCDVQYTLPRNLSAWLVWMRGWRHAFVFPGLSLKGLKPHDGNIRFSTETHAQAAGTHTLQNAIKLNTKFIWHVRTLFSISGVELSSVHDHSFIHFYSFTHAFVSFYVWFVFYRLSLSLPFFFSMCTFWDGFACYA